MKKDSVAFTRANSLSLNIRNSFIVPVIVINQEKQATFLRVCSSVKPTKSRSTRLQKAVSGIGTLIIFIALILIAAIAATVLLQTASSLQSRALQTGRESEQAAASQLKVEGVVGHTADANNIDYVRIIVSLAPGSDSLDLTTTTMTFQTQSTFLTGIRYATTADGNNSDQNALDLSHNGGGTYFSVFFLGYDENFHQASKTGLAPGQQGEIFLWTSTLARNTRAEFNIIPSVGAQTFVRFRTPVIYDGNYVKLFP